LSAYFSKKDCFMVTLVGDSKFTFSAWLGSPLVLMVLGFLVSTGLIVYFLVN
jgi:hypothetical protein